MKKFAAIFISVMLIALMAIAPAVSAAANQDFKDAYKANGTLTLNKYQVVPGGTGTERVKGATFTAYRVYDLSEEGLFSVNTNFNGVAQLATYLNNDKALTYNSTADLEALKPTLQKTAAKLTKDNTGVYEAKDNSDGIYKFASLPLGVYLVVETGVPTNYAVSSVPFLVSIPQWVEDEKGKDGKWEFDVTANPKDDEITLTKFITNGATGEDKTATKDIGDKVEYKITTKIPYYSGKLEDYQKDAITFTFVDKMSSGLTYNGDFVAQLSSQDKEFKAGTGNDYTINVVKDSENNTTITAAFDWDSLNDYQGEEIVFTYSATLNEGAAIGSANENVAKLLYTNDPRKNNSNPDDNDGNPKPGDPVETPESKTDVYTYQMDLKKTFNGADANGTDIKASGVQFTLTKDGKQLDFIKLDDGVYAVYGDNFGTDDTELAPSSTPVDKGRISPTDTGSLVVKGLDEGTYVLSEVSSIDGWSKLASDITITLTGAKEKGEYNGKLESATATPNLTLEVNTKGNAIANGHFGITVNNVKKQFDLPLTGGAGLLMFTIGGGIVIAGAIILFSSFRRKKTAE